MELYISAVQVSGCARRKQGTSDVTEQSAQPCAGTQPEGPAGCQ